MLHGVRRSGLRAGRDRSGGLVPFPTADALIDHKGVEVSPRTRRQQPGQSKGPLGYAAILRWRVDGGSFPFGSAPIPKGASAQRTGTIRPEMISRRACWGEGSNTSTWYCTPGYAR